MMWVFAVLLVLVMGGVAAVAAGHGAPMVDVHDDRPDATVPADGPITSDDLRRVRFSLAFRGYRMSEVDALLDRLARQLAVPADPVTSAAPDVTGAPEGVERPVEQPVEQPVEEDRPGPGARGHQQSP